MSAAPALQEELPLPPERTRELVLEQLAIARTLVAMGQGHYPSRFGTMADAVGVLEKELERLP